MTRSTLRNAAFAFAITAIGSAALLADPPRPAPPAAPPAAPPGTAVDPANPGVQTFRAKQLIGTKIMIQNNTAIGTVDDMVFSDAGDLEYLIVQTADSKLVTVPWVATTYANDFKTATVNITPDQFKTIPTYTTTTYPQFFTPTYRTDVYKWYNVTPRELRRLERRVIRP